MVVPGEALPMVLHASESGDLFLLKLMLYQNDLDTIFHYAMQAMDPNLESATDVVNQFIRFKMFYQASMSASNQVQTNKDQTMANMMPLVFLKSAGNDETTQEELPDQDKIDYMINAVKIDNVLNNVQS